MVATLASLLEIQELDLASDRLRHRSRTLPERADLAAASTEQAELETAASGVETRAHDLGRAQRRHEDEVSALEDKVASTNRQLYGGTVTAPRELQALQDEAAGLDRRIGAAEDALLEVMEALEPVQAEVDRLATARTDVDRRVAGSRDGLTQAEAAIRVELAEVEAARAALAATVPDDLLARYERIRARAGGVGIARLDGHRCTGCHLELPNREVDDLRRLPPDEVAIHDECGRILVRD